MVKVIFGFFILVALLLAGLVYFAGGYQLNFDYVTGDKEAERTLLLDSGEKGSNFYKLEISSEGKVAFQKVDDSDRDNREFQITAKDVQRIKDEVNQSGVLKIVNLNRTYCFVRYDSNIEVDLGWVKKAISYSNCKDDPSEIKNFRKFLYEYLGLTLRGTDGNWWANT